MGRVATLEARAQAVALHGLRDDDRGLALVLHRCLERGVDLLVVVATAAQAPNVGVGPGFDHLRGARVAAEEVLSNKRTRLGLIGLEVTVRGAVHQVPQGTVVVHLKQRVPFTAPDHFDDVPAGTAEITLELLNDLAVTAHRPIEALQVRVDDESEVVQVVVGRDVQSTTRLDFVHLTVTEEGPHVLVGGVFDAAVVQVAIQLGLVNRVNGPETHRHSGELPEPGHQTRVRVRAQATGVVGLLLTETLQLSFTQTALEESSGVHSRCGVALEEHLVATTGVVGAAEEVVFAHFIERRGRGVGRNVATDRNAGALGAVNHDGGIPANPTAVAAFEFLITGELRFVLRRNRVDVVGGGNHRHTQVQLFGALEQREHDFPAALVTSGRHHVVQRFSPLGGFGGIRIHRSKRIGVLIVDSHR